MAHLDFRSDILTRLSKIQAALAENDFESILVTNSYNLKYVSNFTGTSGLAFITQDQGYFITDSRYTQQAEEEASNYTIIDCKGKIYETVADLAIHEKIDYIGIEEDYITISQWDELSDATDCELINSSGLVEMLREVKEDSEVELIQTAVKITEQAFQYILNYIQPGMTEMQVANELDFYMRNKGASGLSFDTIVASGYRSAMPHGVASEKVIEKNELVTIDFGCYYKGYVSDMTRTFAIGKVDDELKKIYDIVKEAHLLVREAASPNITGAQLDAVARDHISKKGYGPQFGHTTGHGIGLEIHENPSVSQKNKEFFVPNNVITNEPGIYLNGLGGVRIENDLLITESGCKDLMSEPIEFIEL